VSSGNSQKRTNPSELISLSAFAPGYISDTALKAGLSPRDLGSVLKAIFSKNYASLETIPNMSPSAYGAIILASKQSSLYGYKYVFITIFPFCLLCAGSMYFLSPVISRFTRKI